MLLHQGKTRGYPTPWKEKDTTIPMGLSIMDSRGDTEMEDRRSGGTAQYDPGGRSSTTKDLAIERTNWAMERTLLANERNFSAWFRTGIAGLAAGLGIGKLLGSLDWPLLTKLIGLFFVGSSGVVSLIAFSRYYRMHDRLRRENATVTPLWLMGVLVLTLPACVVLAGMVLLQRQ